MKLKIFLATVAISFFVFSGGWITHITNWWIDTCTISTPDIDGGTIDDCTVGATTASTGAFTTITATGKITGNGLDAGDAAISNVGDIACDTITEDSDTETQWLVKTWQATIDVNAADSDCDFQFDNTASNSTAQTIEIGPNTVPAFGQILSYMLVCTESIATSGSDEDVLIKLGTSDGGTEIATVSGANALDVKDDLTATAAGDAPEIVAIKTAQDIWIEGDPDGVNWDTYTAGQWQLFITYIDMSQMKE